MCICNPLSSWSQAHQPSTPTANSLRRRSVGAKYNRHRESHAQFLIHLNATYRPGPNQPGLEVVVRSAEESRGYRHLSIKGRNVAALNKSSGYADVSGGPNACQCPACRRNPPEADGALDGISRVHPSFLPRQNRTGEELESSDVVFVAHFIPKIGEVPLANKRANGPPKPILMVVK